MKIKPEETTTITVEKLEKLYQDQLFLEALQEAGVDNWEGYEFAQEALLEDYDED